MSGKQKLFRFDQIKSFPNVLEHELKQILRRSHGFDLVKHPMSGNWNKQFFKNDQPIVLELACGKGEYAVGMGRKFTGKNFLGVDIKGARLWRGAKTALEENLTNVGFLRTRIDFIEAFFEPGEVDEIWITFPDPQPQKNRERKRLTNKMFIDRYARFLKPGGWVHLKTDSDFFFDYTMEEIKEQGYELVSHSYDLYGELIENLDPDIRDILEIKTHYEKIFTEKGHVIKYCKFKIN
jgi:tRNA (guanine-N7-)-methyltransferase